MSKLLLSFLLFAAIAVVPGCTGKPAGVETVTQVDAEKYLGKWYEIARLEHPFERGLEDINANYSKRPDGGIKVVNRGYDPQKKSWQEADGRAYFIDPPNADGSMTGRLKVSFFWPVYSGYNILALDEQYQYAMVSGPTRSYFWILSRTPTMDKALLQSLVDKAKSYGFATEQLIYTPQHTAQ